jgi:zinc-ribbon domain
LNGNVNGNGEIKKLAELKHNYKDEVTELEADLKAKFEQELDAGKKDLKDKYLEKVVDWFFANGFNGNGQPPVPPAPEPVASPEVVVETPPTPPTTPSVQVSVDSGKAPAPDTSAGLQPTGSGTPVVYCDECGHAVRPSDNFCSYCSAPLEKSKITTAGSMVPFPRERERMIRIARQAAEAPKPSVASSLHPDDRHREWARTRRQDS